MIHLKLAGMCAVFTEGRMVDIGNYYYLENGELIWLALTEEDVTKYRHLVNAAVYVRKQEKTNE